MRYAATALLGLVLFLGLPVPGTGQTWPDREEEASEFGWLLGSYLPVSELGSFGRYGIVMDPWFTLGISGSSGIGRDRVRTRFEMTAAPNAKMRRNPDDCPDCSGESHRLSVVNWRFMVDFIFDAPGDSRFYLTAGPFMRVQLSDVDQCPPGAGDDCALNEFARNRVDPGLMVGIGWEPDGSPVRAIQLGGRINHYGRGVLPEARPASWLQSLELSVRLPLAP